ncbi:MAG: type II toxin-antitoxin system HicA family toxin [Azoarcus sp.]|jgi:predicted RNA binding protein YcfA (HicA-like mRNA interferase family)|nr:type II toxin-antitoxin system HicA family toxin [Azoarcus sp.]
MNTARKLLQAMRQNPRDWQIAQLRTLAARLGMEMRNDGGSHHVFSHPGLPDVVCVPAHRPIKPVYIRQFVALCDRAKEIENGKNG